MPSKCSVSSLVRAGRSLRLTASEILVLLVACELASATGEMAWWPRDIAETTGVCVRVVEQIRRTLVERGVLRLQRPRCNRLSQPEIFKIAANLGVPNG